MVKKVKTAVALGFEPGDQAPKIIATGKGHLAEKIIEEAKKAKVPLHHDSKLAETLSRLDFGDYITVEQLDIYLGNLESRSVSLSTYNEVTKEWETIGDRTVTSVFQWNRIDVYYTLRYLGIV